MCDICAVICSNQYDFKKHCEGKKHSKIQAVLTSIDGDIVKLIKNFRGIDKKIKCNICEQCLPNVEIFKKHMDGFKHKYSIGSAFAKGISVSSISPEFLAPIDKKEKDKIVEELAKFFEGTKKHWALDTIVEIISDLSLVKNIKVVFVGGSSNVFKSAFAAAS